VWESLEQIFLLCWYIWKKAIIFQTLSFVMHSDLIFHSDIFDKIHNFALIMLTILVQYFTWVCHLNKLNQEKPAKTLGIKSENLCSKLHSNPVYHFL